MSLLYNFNGVIAGIQTNVLDKNQINYFIYLYATYLLIHIYRDYNCFDPQSKVIVSS